METRARSHAATLAWSLQGVVRALHATVPQRLRPGQETIAFLTRLREQIEKKQPDGLGLTGVAIDNIPRLTNETDPVDVLVVAEALSGVIRCFLEPDERLEQDRIFGFRTN